MNQVRNVGRVVPHDSAEGHVTGDSPYIEDLVLPRDALVVGFVGSPVAAGRIRSIDTTAARRIQGVVGIHSAEDVPGDNRFGPHFRDEPVLADGELLYVGQPVLAVAAETREALEAARKCVVVEAEAAEPILSIERAIELNRFIGPPRRIARGDAAAAIASAPRRLAGVFECGGQEQFYLESQAAIAYPGEAGRMVVHSSTQNTSEIQVVVAEALGVPQNQVVCVCKRMGGAFGGKETQAAIPAVLAALVAAKTGRAARLVYGKDDDMRSTGKRHAYRAEWEVGYDHDGRILGLRTRFFSDGGAAADLSMAVLERTMMHAENAYYLANAEFLGRVCFTNLPPNTAFRGFGGPQAMAAMENVIHEIAADLAADPLDVQLRNLYDAESANVTPYGQIIHRTNLREIMTSLADGCDYHRRREAVGRANSTDRLRLRGIAMSPVKFGISFTTKFLNQANALVNVYTDGSVQVSTGATEMGQGVNTKIRQLVADEFGLGWDRVDVMITSTEKSPNTSPTAASASTDLNGAAAVDACRIVRKRLAAFAARRFASAELGLVEAEQEIDFEDGFVFDRRRPSERVTFGQLCHEAHRDRVDLAARGFYATPGVDFNRETGRGNPFFYFTEGAAVAEVEIDRFTGDLRVSRVDLLIDIGRSINPGVDRGQIVGGFVQGMGWVTAECLVYDEQGRLLSHSPTTYKIPAVTDVPEAFDVRLFENDDNERNVARSKAVGEPPLMLALCVWGAVKQALADALPGDRVPLRLPATGEEILRHLCHGDDSSITDGAAEDPLVVETGIEVDPRETDLSSG